jgi:hypothetical protein
MLPYRRCYRFLLLALATGLAACDDDTFFEVRPPTELNILRLPPDHPPFEATTVSFWARANESREGRIYFLDSEGNRGEEYARLKIDSGSLQARPDGTPFAPEDSILITLSVADPTRVLIHLEPSGLSFRPDKPALLKLQYDEADEDYDDDGDVDGEDDVVEQQLAIWRQAQPGDPYLRLGSVRFEDLREIEATLISFSRYAIAY